MKEGRVKTRWTIANNNNSKQTPVLAAKSFTLWKVCVGLIVLLMGEFTCFRKFEMFLVGTHKGN